MKQFCATGNVAIRHVGMLTMFDKVVRKKGKKSGMEILQKTLSRSIKLLLRSRF